MNDKSEIELIGAVENPNQGCTTKIDFVALETRAQSARVDPGFETLDPVATKIALNQEQRITSLVISPTVAVDVGATVDPDADPLMTRLGAMTLPELKTYIKDGLATGEAVLVEEKQIADRKRKLTWEMVCALRELRDRLKASKTWQKALKELGIAPSTFRSYDCRELNELTTGKRTKSRKKAKVDKRTPAQLHADGAAAKAAVDAQRAASLAQPDPVEVEAEYVDEPDVVPEAPRELEPEFKPKPRTIKQIEQALKEADADSDAITWLEQVVKAVANGKDKQATKARRALRLMASLWSEAENIHPYPTREELDRLKVDKAARVPLADMTTPAPAKRCEGDKK
jgi:hypothetical protein